MKWFTFVIKNAFDFSGRATRAQYWWFALFNFIFCMVFMLLDTLLGTSFDEAGFGVLYLLYCLFALVPGLSVSIRRLHDIGKSGWALLISLIPIVGVFILLAYLCTSSEPGENQWGVAPQTPE